MASDNPILNRSTSMAAIASPAMPAATAAGLTRCRDTRTLGAILAAAAAAAAAASAAAAAAVACPAPLLLLLRSLAQRRCRSRPRSIAAAAPDQPRRRGCEPVRTAHALGAHAGGRRGSGRRAAATHAAAAGQPPRGAAHVGHQAQTRRSLLTDGSHAERTASRKQAADCSSLPPYCWLDGAAWQPCWLLWTAVD